MDIVHGFMLAFISPKFQNSQGCRFFLFSQELEGKERANKRQLGEHKKGKARVAAPEVKAKVVAPNNMKTTAVAACFYFGWTQYWKHKCKIFLEYLKKRHVDATSGIYVIKINTTIANVKPHKGIRYRMRF